MLGLDGMEKRAQMFPSKQQTILSAPTCQLFSDKQGRTTATAMPKINYYFPILTSFLLLLYSFYNLINLVKIKPHLIYIKF